MKFLTNKIAQFKVLYKKNKLQGIFLGLGIVLLCAVVLPELIIIFAPKVMFDYIWKLQLTKVYRVLLLILSLVLWLSIIFYTVTKLKLLFKI